jgi:hypothetical protein
MRKCDAMARRGDGIRMSNRADSIEITSPNSSYGSESTESSVSDDPMSICTVFSTSMPASLPSLASSQSKNETRGRSDEDFCRQPDKQGKEFMRRRHRYFAEN